jgi:hypothetical protein
MAPAALFLAALLLACLLHENTSVPLAHPHCLYLQSPPSPQILYTYATPLLPSTLDQSPHYITPLPRRPRDTAQTNLPVSG